MAKKNDLLIKKLIKDPNFRIESDGTVHTRISRQGHKSDVWRVAGNTCEGYRVLRYNYTHLFIHRIIYQKFIGELKDGLTINHIDGVGTNNRPENLEQVTQAANNLHRFRVLKTGPVIGNKKLNLELADQIRADRASGVPIKTLQTRFNVSKGTIIDVIMLRRWVRKLADTQVSET